MNKVRQPLIVGIFIAVFVALFYMTGCATAPPSQKEQTPEELQAIQDSINQVKLDSLRLLLSLGGEHYRQKNYDRALIYFRKIVYMDFGGIKDERLNRIYKYVGVCYTQKTPADDDSAAWAHLRGVEQVPDDPYNYEALIHIYKKQGKTDDAINMASALTGLVPDKAEYWAELAGLYMTNNDCDNCIPAMREAVKLDSNQKYQQDLTMYMKQCGIDTEQLIAEYKKLVEQDPANLQYRIDLSKNYISIGEYGKAAKHLEIVTQKDVTNIPALEMLGQCYQETEQSSKAVATYNKILAINPEDTKNLCNLSMSYTAMGNYSTALSKVGQALSLDPQYGLAFITKGMIYETAADKCSDASDKITFHDKLTYELAYKEYLNAAKDIQWRSEANRRMAYVKPLLPTKSDQFMNRGVTRPEGPCYQWIP